VLLQIHSITASKFAWSRPPSTSPNSLYHSLQVYHQSRLITASQFATLCHQCASLSSLDHSVVKQWSLKADSGSSTLRCTLHSIQTEFLRLRNSGCRSIGRGWEYMKEYPATMNHMLHRYMNASQECVTNYTESVDLWLLGKGALEQGLGKKQCVFRIMRQWISIPWSPKYTRCHGVHRHYPGISICICIGRLG